MSFASEAKGLADFEAQFFPSVPAPKWYCNYCGRMFIVPRFTPGGQECCAECGSTNVDER